MKIIKIKKDINTEPCETGVHITQEETFFKKTLNLLENENIIRRYQRENRFSWKYSNRNWGEEWKQSRGKKQQNQR